MQQRLFKPADEVRCEIRRKLINGHMWYTVEVFVNGESIYWAPFFNEEDSRADSARIKEAFT